MAKFDDTQVFDSFGITIAGSGGGCFRKGSLVQLQQGRTVPIEDLRVGDQVLSFDEQGRIHVSTITETHHHPEPQPLLYVRFWRGEMYITPNHWVLNQYGSFVEVGTLTTEDALVDGMGHLRPILSITEIAPEPTYNLSVSPNHTFICNGVRVHNGGHRERYPVVAGSGGGSSKGGGGSARQAIEYSDTLESRAMISVLDLVGEGEISGLVEGGVLLLLQHDQRRKAC